MHNRRTLAASVLLTLVTLVQGCDVLAPEATTFPELRYFAAEAGSPWFAFALKLCPDGRVDMLVSDFGLHGTYRLADHRVHVVAGASEWNYTLSTDKNALTDEENGLVLVRNRQAEGESPTCLDGVER